MRGPKEQAKLTQEEWRALMRMEMDSDEVRRDPAKLEAQTAGWFEASYLWSNITLASYTRALVSAHQHRQVLVYCQAADFSLQIPKPDRLVYERALAVPSLSQTARVPAMALFHVGMRVRLMTQVLPPWAGQDASGTVMEIVVSDADKRKL